MGFMTSTEIEYFAFTTFKRTAGVINVLFKIIIKFFFRHKLITLPLQVYWRNRLHSFMK